jgi:hypothetical protein
MFRAFWSLFETSLCDIQEGKLVSHNPWAEDWHHVLGLVFTNDEGENQRHLFTIIDTNHAAKSF